MNQFLARLLVAAVWPIVAVCALVVLAVFFVMLWPILLLTPVRFEGGKIKVGEEAEK